MSTSVRSHRGSTAGGTAAAPPSLPRRARALAWPAALAVAAAVAVPALNDPYYEGLAVSALILVALATSWNVVGGFGGQLSFGHAAFYGLGAYAAGKFVNSVDLPVGLAVLGALVCAVLVGAISSVIVIPGFRSRGPYFAILTLAMAESFQLLGQYFLPGRTQGLLVKAQFAPGDHTPYWVALAVAVAAVEVAAWVRRSRLGAGLFAIRDDLEAAASVGVPTVRVRATAFAISAGIAGAAGGVYALTQVFVDPPTVFAPNLSVLPVLIVTLGGTGTVSGPVIGALVWAGLNDVLSNYTANAGYTTTVYGVLLVLLAVLLPRGIMGLLDRRTVAVAAVRRAVRGRGRR